MGALLGNVDISHDDLQRSDDTSGSFAIQYGNGTLEVVYQRT